jgi:hypothetical protein
VAWCGSSSTPSGRSSSRSIVASRRAAPRRGRAARGVPVYPDICKRFQSFAHTLPSNGRRSRPPPEADAVASGRHPDPGGRKGHGRLGRPQARSVSHPPFSSATRTDLGLRRAPPPP